MLKKTLHFIAIFWLCVSTIGFAEEVKKVSKEDWLAVIEERKQFIEKELGVKFDADWKPRVAFKIPESVSPDSRAKFTAKYEPETESFAVSPKLKQKIDVVLIDHELGHAFMDQLSRRIGNGVWLDEKTFPNLEHDLRVGLIIASEGVGMYFQYQGVSPYLNGDTGGERWLPSWSDDLLWESEHVKYLGGYWLVAPIIRQYGERGIIYLIKNPLRYRDGNVRDSALEYQRVALEKLANDDP